MKLLLTLNMPAGMEDFPTHMVILEVNEGTLLSAIDKAADRGWFYGLHMTYEKTGGARVWSNRGALAVNVEHVGKVAEYYEGGKR